jgi:anti-anti-sigma factor
MQENTIRRKDIVVGLQVSNRQSGGVAIVDLRGRSTIGGESDSLSSHLNQLISHGARQVLLNLTDLTQVDSSGVSAIVAAYVSLRRLGGALKLLRPSGRVLVVLKVTHVLDMIPHFEEEVQAVASFEPRSYVAKP